ncbi:RHS repeat domain-containing protein [Hymenobacter crusticola]|uniref:YD repeat-containing protein n=1 Tax=Hymenobacter crusticola TaxID=1770526 RepID=A0A243W6D6_9BACT|nr:RHS repeat domain-containing protein [Hymenobacter crusticola]OUJ69391.1 hypothetical protein BXP70_26505 [Hymenobacter crusticola]
MITFTCRRLTLLFFFFLILFESVRAQQSSALYSQVSIASPTASALGKYADIPVNHHTGIPEINVPIYTIAEGPLTLPIGLSYHAGGIKVQEPAGWVGTGWALNAGGVITRSVQDKPDERGTTNATRGHFSDYGYNSYWTEGGSDVYTASGANAPYDYGFANGQYDGEPDLYFFNFNGYSGKFYFNDDRTPVVVDGQDLKIEYYYPSANQSPGTSASFNIQGFIITVPTGDKYYFGVTDSSAPSEANPSPVETTHSSAEDNLVTDNVYSSYYLAKVVAADGVHAITLTYAREKYCYYTIAMSPIRGNGIVNGAVPVGAYLHEYSLVKNNIDGVRLAQIAFSTGKVTFNSAASARTDLGEYLTGGLLDDYVNTQARALGSIAVSATDFCKQYSFLYSYFKGDTTPLAAGIQVNSAITTDITRLKLDKIQETSCDGTIAMSPWVFAYKTDFLPRRLSFAQDHWGFYNGQNQNNQINTLIPTYYGDINNSIPLFNGANRNPSAPAMTNGVLTSITYPMGGSTTFEYEPNDVWVSYRKYEYQEVFSRCVGSLCGSIQQTFDVPFSGNPYRVTLDYTSNSNSTYPGKAWVSGVSPSLSLTVSKQDRKFHDETVIQPSLGTRSFYMGSDIGVGSSEGAIVTFYENRPRTVEENALAGGLRIRSITTRANASEAGIVTNYTYRDGQGHSTGTLYSRPRYVQVIRNDFLAEFGYKTFTPDPDRSLNGCLNSASSSQLYLASPCGILPMSTTQGNHLGYDQVTVAQSGNGRTDYYYYGDARWTNYNDVCIRNVNPSACDPTIPNVPAVPLRYDFSRGLLKYQRVFDEQGQYLKSMQYTYAYDSSKATTPAYIVKYVAGAMLGSRYERRSYWTKQTQVIETEIAAGQSRQTTTITAYNNPYHRQPTRTTEFLPSGDSLTTRYKYAFELRAPACETIADGMSSYTDRCASCDAVLRTQLAQAPDETWVHKYKVDNWLCRATARKDYIAYRRTTFTNSTNTYQTTHNTAKNAADSNLKPLLQLQDDYKNELVETSKWKNGRLLSAAYTAFGPDLTQGTKMYPAKLFSLFLDSPSASFTPITVNGNGVSIDNRYSNTPETTLKYDRGNLTEVLPRLGVATSYVWGYNNTLPIAKAVGVGYATLSAAYNRVRGDLTTMRNQSSLANSLLSTYTYKPLVGLISQTDPSGRTIYYEYDALGRLARTVDDKGRLLQQQEYKYALQP